jgi:predicted ATPase/5S rRNA maturation endonuclease (ribonuclease M5)
LTAFPGNEIGYVKLKSVVVDGFRSVKDRISLFANPRISILIGANDHGKTTLLEAIRCLNDDRPIVAEDENWDSVGKGKPTLEYKFKLDPEELAELTAISARFQAAQTREESAPAAESPTPESPAESENDTSKPSVEAALPPIPQIPTVIEFTKAGVGGELSLKPEPFSQAVPEAGPYIKKCIPRVELFKPVDQIMDAVTLAELEDPNQEFMQGVFRYAGIWDGHETLFRQDPATTRRLERASTDFTRKIHEEWKQGENLEFKFQHAGKSGDQIELLISDPAVTERSVRPSERSAGFSAFFTMSMRMLARTEANLANKYILLFDEPGTSLHPAGQVNLQKVFERLSIKDQIVYATHSLFMINHNRPERNKVVSKEATGTQIDQKPFLRNWRAVRDSLGLILAGNFFIADRTLIVEGESDAMYVGALLAAFDRAGVIDIDLNLFSVQWPGNSRDYEPMARLMLEEGRQVVALMDGDKSGTDIRKNIEKLNAAVDSGRVQARASVSIVQHEKGQSIEDILPMRDKYFETVIAAATSLVTDGFREWAEGIDHTAAKLTVELAADKGSATLGKHVADVSKKWFKEKEPISKLTVANRYCEWLETITGAGQGVAGLPPTLGKLIEFLKLDSKLSKEAVTGEADG